MIQNQKSVSNDNNGIKYPLNVTNAFVVTIPGKAMITSCIKISNDKYLFNLNIYPITIKSLCISILNLNNLPNNMGFVIFYSLPPYNNWEYLGCIHNEYPSIIINSPEWLLFKNISQCQSIRIGIEIKHKNLLKSLNDKQQQLIMLKQNKTDKIKQEFAVKVAKNLYNYLSSFINDNENQKRTAKALDTWIQKFNAKYKRDPNFLDK